MNFSEISSTGIHPVELCVYSILSSNLEGIYQAINELRESQALLVMKLNQIKSKFQEEQKLLDEQVSLKKEVEMMNTLTKRVDSLVNRYTLLRRQFRVLEY